MFFWKGRHKCGLDYKIYQYVRSKLNKKLSQDYYLYIFDVGYPRSQDFIDPGFFSSKNHSGNTWNYDLQYHSTRKDTIVKESVKFGFGDQSYDEHDDFIVVKGIGHHMASKDKKLYKAQLVKREIYESSYEKTKYIGLKCLKTSKTSNITEELNVYALKDLNTNTYHLKCLMITNNTDSNINRKYSKNTNFKEVDTSILGSYLPKLIQYMNHIKFDYGRIELIHDYRVGWCILDVNNSPGGGPLTSYIYKDLGDILIKLIV